MKSSINWFAVIVATVAAMFVGFLWYGLFFQDAWAAAVGMTGPGLVTAGEEVFKYGEPVVINPVTPMIFNTLIMFGYAVVLAWLTGRAQLTGWMKGAYLGGVIGALMAFSHYISNMFAMEPTSLSIIDGSYHVVLLAVIGAIVGGWRKKVVV